MYNRSKLKVILRYKQCEEPYRTDIRSTMKLFKWETLRCQSKYVTLIMKDNENRKLHLGTQCHYIFWAVKNVWVFKKDFKKKRMVLVSHWWKVDWSCSAYSTLFIEKKKKKWLPYKWGRKSSAYDLRIKCTLRDNARRILLNLKKTYSCRVESPAWNWYFTAEFSKILVSLKKTAIVCSC